MKTKILAIIGKSGSGKDAILNFLAQNSNNFHRVVSVTTRPKRDYEIDHVHAHFVDPIEFATELVSGSLIEASEFRDWFYGTRSEDYDTHKINILACDPDRVLALLDAGQDYDVQVLLIDTSAKTRLLRSLNREEDPDIDEIIRRYKADETNYFDLSFSYTVIDNDKNGIMSAINNIYAYLKSIMWI